MDIENAPTVKLVEELEKREGVKSETVLPYEEYVVEESGPVIILVVSD